MRITEKIEQPVVQKETPPVSQKKPPKDRVHELETMLNESNKKAEEYLTKLQYVQAEFENYKKIAAKEREKYIQNASEGIILKLIDVYENLERAIENGKKTENKDSFLSGVTMTYEQLKGLLEKEGLTPIKAVGEKFDPFRHEAIMQEKKEDCEEDTVLEEFQRGYTLNGKVIRYSKVKISKR